MRKTIIVVAAAIFILVGSALAVFGSATTLAFEEDSGIVACKQMANRVDTADTSKPNAMTEESYKRARKPFENSTHEDLRSAGIMFVDGVFNSQKVVADDAAGLEDTLGVLVALRTGYGALQVACGNHGVKLPELSV